MAKLDLRKQLADLYPTGIKATKQPVLVDVPELNYLMIDGKGDPNNSREFQDAMITLYGLAYTIKFLSKLGPTGRDWTVMPLQGLWWSDDMSDFVSGAKDRWKWTVMILQPDFVDQDMFVEARENLRRKKNPAAIDLARLELFGEGKAAQILYIGPYADEAPIIQRLHEFIHEQGYELSGKHHEIYLSDPRRTAPEKLKTIIRQPVK